MELFIAHLSGTGRAYAVPYAVSAVRLHLNLADSVDFTGSQRIRDITRGVAHVAAQGKEDIATRDPLPVSVVTRMWANGPLHGQTRQVWLRDLLLIALGLRLMRRPSELARIRRRHIVPDSQGWVWVLVPETKTNKSGKGKRIPIEPSRDSPTCPVHLLQLYLQAVPGSPDDLLFHTVRYAQLSSSAITSIVQRAAASVGVQGRFTGYSLRIGGATAAVAAGMTMAQIRSVGDWESKAVLHYLRAVGAATARMTERMGF